MSDPEWAHLQPLVDALVAVGNEPLYGGFRGNQGGTDCYMRDPLDYDVLRPLVAQDPHRDRISMGDDRLDCLHCWAGIGGADYLAAVDGRPRGSRGRASAALRLLAVVVSVVGLVFTLQGFGVIGGSFMSGSATWAVIGIAMVAAGTTIYGYSTRT